MELGEKRITAGNISFALSYRLLDGGAPHTTGAGSPGGNNADQGVCIQVVAQVNGKESELLRFDCFDLAPHYHYGPEKENIRINLDTTTAGNPIGWTLRQLKTKLPQMLERSDYADIARKLDADTVSSALESVESMARQMAIDEHNTVTHNRGTDIFEAGAIRFGLEMRDLGFDGGLAIHVLGDVAGQEIELLAFDCFRGFPHYHYGPRNENERIYLDTTTVPDPLSWTLDQFKSGNLPNMIKRAGYPTIANSLDSDVLSETIQRIESRAADMVAATS